MSDQMRMLKRYYKNSPKPAETPNRGRNQEVSDPTVCTPSPKTALNKENGKAMQETIKENITTEYAKLPLPAKFRNKIVDKERYYSDKEINYIIVFHKILNH